MKKYSGNFILTVIFICLFPQQILSGGLSIKKLWETGGFKNPESVIYDEKNHVLYLSNVNGSAVEKDGNGFISKVSPGGRVLELEWVSGLNAPKGLAVYNNKLYTADIDALVEIDIPTAMITNIYRVDDARFLNDVTVDQDGKVFVSDMMMNRIHCLENGKFNIWLESPELENPNGLLVEGDSIILGSWGVMKDGFATDIPGHLKSISLDDKVVKSIGDGQPVGNLDGVESDQHGNYYVTDWMAGKLLHIDNNGNFKVLLSLEQGMADHEFITGETLFLIPMMKSNKLLAYKLQ